MKNDAPALSMLVFGFLALAMGLAGLFAPQILIGLLGFDFLETRPPGDYTLVYAMASAQASLAVGLYYILAAVNEFQAFFRWSVPLRIVNFCVFSTMVLIGIAPSGWLLVALFELSGALLTALALKWKDKLPVSLDCFNTLRIISVLLATLGALVAVRPIGLYGAASLFLAIFSAGFIYAYQKFSPSGG